MINEPRIATADVENACLTGQAGCLKHVERDGCSGRFPQLAGSCRVKTTTGLLMITVRSEGAAQVATGVDIASRRPVTGGATRK